MITETLQFSADWESWLIVNSAGRLQSLFHSSLIVYSCCASLGSQGGCALELQVLKSFCNEQKCWKRVYPMENHSLENHDTLVVFTVSSNTVLELIKSAQWIGGLLQALCLPSIQRWFFFVVCLGEGGRRCKGFISSPKTFQPNFIFLLHIPFMTICWDGFLICPVLFFFLATLIKNEKRQGILLSECICTMFGSNHVICLIT